MLFEALWPIGYQQSLAELGRRLVGERFDVVHRFRLYNGLLRLLRWHGTRFDRSILDLDDYESQVGIRSATAFRTLIGNKLSAVPWPGSALWNGGFWRLCSFPTLMMP